MLDLGCGDGALTLVLHERSRAERTLGLDRSARMLAGARASSEVRFVRAAIERPPLRGRFDLVFSNAALQWVEDHPRLLGRLRTLVEPGGELCVQVPANDEHASHRAAAEVAREEPFRTALGGYVRRSPVLTADGYASLLGELGYRDVDARTVVYEHLLPARDGVLAWVEGSLLTDYAARLGETELAAFTARYRERLAETLPDARPFRYQFTRVLFRAVRAPGPGR